MSTLKTINVQHPTAASANIVLDNLGNVSIPTSGARITGDFSNATVANRVAFQTSTTNGFTVINVIPNGTQTSASIRTVNNSDPTNAAFTAATVTSAESQFAAGIYGTGSYLPMTFYTGGSERMRIDTSGNVGINYTNMSSLGAKLYCYGYSGFGASANGSMSLGSRSNFTSTFENTSGGYGLGININAATGIAQLQSQRFDGTATAYDIALNPLGGNVGIGTTGPAARLDLGRATAINQIQAVLARQVAPGDGDFRLVASTGAGTSVDNEFFRVGITYNANFLAGMNLYRGQGSTDGYLAFSTTATERVRIDANGNVGIGVLPNTSYILRTTTDGGKGVNLNTFAMGKSGGDYAWAGYNFVPTASSGVYTYNATDFAAAIRYGQSGAIQVFTASSGTSGTTISWASGPYVANAGTSWTSASDERLKNITGLITDALPKVSQLRAAKFTWKSDSTNKPQVGLIAQDVLKVLPEAVDTTTDPEAFGVSYTEVIPLLVSAIQELKAELDAVKAELATVKGA